VGITPALKALESCSNPQKTQHIFKSAMKNNFFGLGLFVIDIVSEVVLGLFGSLHLALGPNC